MLLWAREHQPHSSFTQASLAQLLEEASPPTLRHTHASTCAHICRHRGTHLTGTGTPQVYAGAQPHAENIER